MIIESETHGMGCISVEGVIWLVRSRGVSAFVYLLGGRWREGVQKSDDI